MDTIEATTVRDLATRARAAAAHLAGAGRAQKDEGLLRGADALEARASEVVAANAEDVAAARRGDVSTAAIDRLTLGEERIGAIAAGLRTIAALDDPIGEILDRRELPNGLVVEKVRVPLGVIGVIYEGRPNVTVDAAGLALKAGSASLLRGSRLAERSNAALVAVLRDAVEAAGFPADVVQLVPATRAHVEEMLRARGLIDLLIPRGGNDLIERVVRESLVPVIETGVGNCHVYVDAAADLDMAEAILVNAKVQRPAVCNAAESFLVHERVAEAFGPRALRALVERGVTIYGDETLRRLGGEAGVEVQPAGEDEYRAEFLDLRIAGRVVGSLEEAIEHIAEYGTSHTETIVTEDPVAAERFLAAVDAAVVMVNASTRFTDGGEFGFGAEIGISTQKLHARGPMGLPEITTHKYVVRGRGQIRT